MSEMKIKKFKMECENIKFCEGHGLCVSPHGVCRNFFIRPVLMSEGRSKRKRVVYR